MKCSYPSEILSRFVGNHTLQGLHMNGTGLNSEAQPRALERVADVVLSKWVNEGPPPCHDLLSAHDVARITHRPCWVLELLALTGRFPAKARFHGRPLGWLRQDVLDWMAGSLSLSDKPVPKVAHFAQTPTRRGCGSTRSLRDEACARSPRPPRNPSGPSALPESDARP